PDANQYTPVFNGLTGWQLYHGEGYGTPVNYEFDTWIPVRIVVSGHQAEMYIKDLQHPVLFADELKREPVAGAIALTNANFAGAHFSNFRYSVIEEPILKGVVARERVAPEGAIMSWSVSTTFDEAALGEATELSTELLESLAWNTLQCESTGVVNVSKLRALARGQNTVLASISLSAKQSTRAVLSFGYSDRVRVYLNGSLLYSGNNGYRSRDYRYLGTIGLFDTVVVSLNEGRNELAFAVSETFGGWGLKAVLDSSDGISVNP
ncbi:MAG: hypothetical protein GY906_15030, partial [bacterium]|nr:hypothetical protein [bacterium]